MSDSNSPICGYKGDQVCEPPNCGGACPSNGNDSRPNKTLTPEQSFQIAALINKEWSLAFKAKEAVLAERNDGSPDWEDFHKMRVVQTDNHEAELLSLRNAFTDIYKKDWNF